MSFVIITLVFMVSMGELIHRVGLSAPLLMRLVTYALVALMIAPQAFQ